MTNGEGRRTSAVRRRPAERRGVLMLVVLSVLVLFMLIGTAFLMSSKHEKDSAEGMARVERVGNKPTALLDRALRTLLRDTENPHSVARYHSLLRDLYGGDGFEAVVLRAEYAGVTEFPATAANGGPTVGQLIDIYVANDPSTRRPAAVKIDRDPLGQKTAYQLSTTRSYYNGQLLTITRGPAAGQTARIVDYEAAYETSTDTVFARMRVMSFPRSDGQPLIPESSSPYRLLDLTDAGFLVNGRALNGTGVGYNPLARQGEGRLNAVEFGQVDGNWLGVEVALTPNPVHLNLPTVGAPNPNAMPPLPFPFDPFVAGRTGMPGPFLPLTLAYPNYAGLGDADESYDTIDFQNIWLAGQTVLPRPRGRFVVQPNPGNPGSPPLTVDLDAPVIDPFLRFDLEDLPKPSFHDMALVNFWYHRLLVYLTTASPMLTPDDAVRAIAQPYDPTTGAPTSGMSTDQAALVAFIKRKIMLRPSRVDHPKFDGGNPSSVPPYPLPAPPPSFGSYVTNGTINYPFWEIVGPWDVDNDNDGVADSMWIDLGDPVLETENGTRYKALYAVKIVDLDNRLNVNAHGTTEHLAFPRDRPTAMNLSHDLSAGPLNSNTLAQGSGWGVGDISLRPIMPVVGGVTATLNIGSPGLDDYARLFYGRPGGTYGRHGWVSIARPPAGMTPLESLRPGMTFDNTSMASALATSDPLSMLKFIGHPLFVGNYFNAGMYFPTAFGTPPDLMGRYPLGLDFVGQPAVVPAADSASLLVGPNYPLLMDSPYELDLSSPRRKDTPAAAMITAMAAGTAPLVSDDAPFATADLERILRAPDADAGTLPSRLWDVVSSFDPQRMGVDHLGLVNATAMQLFSGMNPPTPPEQLAAAQLLASVNRQQVTTDSFGLPVPNIVPPAYMLTPYPFPFAATQPAFVPAVSLALRRPTNMSEMFEARIRRFFGWPSMYDDYEAGGDHDGDGQINYDPTAMPPYDPEYNPTDLTNGNGLLSDQTTLPIRAARISAIINGGTWTDANNVQHVEPGVAAPELLAGLRMDINRPFGDGRDNPIANAVNGIVDDPLEAGDPFLDINGDGKWNDAREPFIDVDGDGRYSPPQDQLWAGLTSEPIAFDYLNGNGEPLHPLVRAGWLTTAAANVRNLDSQGRQRFARHLYCLMLLLMDDNYIETPDVPSLGGDNINQEWYREAVEAAVKLENPMAPAELINEYVMRKLTARRIAQWAINVADMRDADAIMTPFEYDENPWDGWGVLVPDPDDPTDPAKFTNLPLDGDAATDENKGEVIAWRQVPAAGNQRVISPTPADGSTVPRLVPAPIVANRTRGLMWGAERPELLITETLAWHDRRATDESSAQSPSITASTANPPDFTLDQRLKPRGSLLFELHNPSSPDGPRPAEFYGTPNPPGSPTGVMLNRLSDIGATDASGRFKRSPVWRATVLRDPINGQLTNQVIDITQLTAPGGADEVESYATQFLSTDPDGYGMNMDVHAERFIYFTSGGDLDRRDNNYLINAPPTPPGAAADYRDDGTSLFPLMNNLYVRVPPLPTRKAPRPGSTMAQLVDYPAARRYFVARPSRSIDSIPGSDTDVPIAPILPGRYAVIGPSGLQLNSAGQPRGTMAVRFVTPVSRLIESTGSSPSPDQRDDRHISRLNHTRRFEFWPSTDPDRQQFLIAENGGPEFVRLAASVTPRNVTDSQPRNGEPDYSVTNPAIAVPVEDLNTSEPVEGYPSRRYQQLHYDNVGTLPSTTPPTINAEGELYFTTAYDVPLDLDFELVGNRTTQNYRSLHLQRLANPTLPWNPLPYDEKGAPNPLHLANMPVNPYLTIDSQSIDLTSFNGASRLERTLPKAGTSQVTVTPQIPNEPYFQSDFFAPLPAESLVDAPDHVLWALYYILNKEAGTAYTSVADFRTQLQNSPGQVEVYLQRLETNRESQDYTRRGTLLANRTDSSMPTRKWNGQWGWHMFRRVLPDDKHSIPTTNGQTGSFKQRLHLKSLERGSHDSVYYPKFTTTFPNGWWYDTNWEPRLLWKQERPNVMLFLKDATGNLVRATDLVNAKSARVLKGGASTEDTISPDPADETMRNMEIWSQLYANDPMLNIEHVVDFVVEQTLGFSNDAYSPELDRSSGDNAVARMATIAPGAPEVAINTANEPVGPSDINETNASPRRPSLIASNQAGMTPAIRAQLAQDLEKHRKRLTESTYPWFPWPDRPFVSAEEIMQVPAGSSSLMLRDYSVINRGTENPYDGDGLFDDGTGNFVPNLIRRLGVEHSPFGHLLNFFASARNPAAANFPAGMPTVLLGAPNYHRILDYIHVPSRFVGTETVLSPVVFNDVPRAADPAVTGGDIQNPLDPRYLLQPPFNKVSRQREPGQVNLNTVTGRRAIDPSNGVPIIWSDVFDGIMHRYQDGVQSPTQLGHLGPAWRDVLLSRRGYAQLNADGSPVDRTGMALEYPDTLAQGLNPNFPTFVANPLRSSDAGDLVPLAHMAHSGVDVTWQRRHHYTRNSAGDGAWGTANDDNLNGLVNDLQEAGFGDDILTADPATGRLLNDAPSQMPPMPDVASIPLFSETAKAPFVDGERNPGMMYQPMTRLGNLVTNRSNVFAVWITVGYFEVEPAPNWNDPNAAVQAAIRARFGGDINLYNRVYPEGYMLGREVGSETGNTQRQRGFYIIDRTQEVGFKPGEDLNVEKMILLRRRIE